jgi:hypothetical protein
MAEMFASSDETVSPGSVMSIDPDRPGITLNAAPAAPSRVTVTLSGTVYCLASNANGPVQAGDLLTSSAVPGHAMRAGDAGAGRGAVIGKALEDLRGDRGLILILASLQ